MLAKFKYKNEFEYEKTALKATDNDLMHKIQKEILTTVVYPCPRQKLYLATR